MQRCGVQALDPLESRAPDAKTAVPNPRDVFYPLGPLARRRSGLYIEEEVAKIRETAVMKLLNLDESLCGSHMDGERPAWRRLGRICGPHVTCTTRMAVVFAA